MESLENRISYKFNNPLLLAEALTHPSLAYETQGPHFDNQRLEFLGDAVLQLILTRELFQTFPHLNEGTLTKLRSQLVSRPALQRYAQDIGLGEFLLMGKGEEISGGRSRPSTLADALEALVGAIYLDSDLAAAKRFVLSLCHAEIRNLDHNPDSLNPKGQLQEILQTEGAPSPVYTIVAQEGPDHCKSFLARVDWEGHTLGSGSGNSKKQAETNAAREALLHPVVRTVADGLSAGRPVKRVAAPSKRPPAREPVGHT